MMNPKAMSGSQKAWELLEQACADEGQTDAGYRLGYLSDELKKLIDGVAAPSTKELERIARAGLRGKLRRMR